MSVLSDFKLIKNINPEDTAQDNLINLYIRRSATAIKKYLNIADSVDIEATYPDAMIEYVIIKMNRKGNEGLKQFSQGSISGTYNDDMPDSVKDLLPLPFCKLMG